ncbi:MAG: HD domain-containing protein, partial [Candidatus Omnitrophica bacterium]|nr:HD domain-containing protein [Candidatus Omnitrophota bacterium]
RMWNRILSEGARNKDGFWWMSLGEQNLANLNRYIQNADIVVSPDTYAMHAAAAANKWTISLWGSRVDTYLKWAPQGNRHLPLMTETEETGRPVRKPAMPKELLLRTLMMTVDAVYEEEVGLRKLEDRVQKGRLKNGEEVAERKRLATTLDRVFRKGARVRGMRRMNEALAHDARLLRGIGTQFRSVHVARRDITRILKKMTDLELLDIHPDYQSAGFHYSPDASDPWRGNISVLMRSDERIAQDILYEYLTVCPTLHFMRFMVSHNELLRFWGVSNGKTNGHGSSPVNQTDPGGQFGVTASSPVGTNRRSEVRRRVRAEGGIGASFVPGLSEQNGVNVSVFAEKIYPKSSSPMEMVVLRGDAAREAVVRKEISKQIIELERRYIPRGSRWTEKEINARIDNEWFALFNNGRFLGYSVFNKELKVLSRLVIKENDQGRGLGSFLLDDVLKEVNIQSFFFTPTGDSMPFYLKYVAKSNDWLIEYEGSFGMTWIRRERSSSPVDSQEMRTVTIEGLRNYLNRGPFVEGRIVGFPLYKGIMETGLDKDTPVSSPVAIVKEGLLLGEFVEIILTLPEVEDKAQEIRCVTLTNFRVNKGFIRWLLDMVAGWITQRGTVVAKIPDVKVVQGDADGTTDLSKKSSNPVGAVVFSSSSPVNLKDSSDPAVLEYLAGKVSKRNDIRKILSEASSELIKEIRDNPTRFVKLNAMLDEYEGSKEKILRCAQDDENEKVETQTVTVSLRYQSPVTVPVVPQTEKTSQNRWAIAENKEQVATDILTTVEEAIDDISVNPIVDAVISRITDNLLFTTSSVSSPVKGMNINTVANNISSPVIDMRKLKKREEGMFGDGKIDLLSVPSLLIGYSMPEAFLRVIDPLLQNLRTAVSDEKLLYVPYAHEVHFSVNSTMKEIPESEQDRFNLPRSTVSVGYIKAREREIRTVLNGIGAYEGLLAGKLEMMVDGAVLWILDFETNPEFVAWINEMRSRFGEDYDRPRMVHMTLARMRYVEDEAKIRDVEKKIKSVLVRYRNGTGVLHVTEPVNIDSLLFGQFDRRGWKSLEKLTTRIEMPVTIASSPVENDSTLPIEYPWVAFVFNSVFGGRTEGKGNGQKSSNAGRAGGTSGRGNMLRFARSRKDSKSDVQSAVVAMVDTLQGYHQDILSAIIQYLHTLSDLIRMYAVYRFAANSSAHKFIPARIVQNYNLFGLSRLGVSQLQSKKPGSIRVPSDQGSGFRGQGSEKRKILHQFIKEIIAEKKGELCPVRHPEERIDEGSLSLFDTIGSQNNSIKINRLLLLIHPWLVESGILIAAYSMSPLRGLDLPWQVGKEIIISSNPAAASRSSSPVDEKLGTDSILNRGLPLIKPAVYISEQVLKKYAMLSNRHKAVASAIIGLLAEMDKKGNDLRGHSERVAVYAFLLGRQMGYEDLLQTYLSALVHDIGKVCTPGEILNSHGFLAGGEVEITRLHVISGKRIFEKLIEQVPELKAFMDGIAYHPENPDGSGYPKGSEGHIIPMNAHVIKFADALDAMTKDRLYRGGFNVEEIVSEIIADKGAQFHPDPVKALTRLYQSGELDDLIDNRKVKRLTRAIIMILMAEKKNVDLLHEVSTQFHDISNMVAGAYTAETFLRTILMESKHDYPRELGDLGALLKQYVRITRDYLNTRKENRVNIARVGIGKLKILIPTANARLMAAMQWYDRLEPDPGFDIKEKIKWGDKRGEIEECLEGIKKSMRKLICSVSILSDQWSGHIISEDNLRECVMAYSIEPFIRNHPGILRYAIDRNLPEEKVSAHFRILMRVIDELLLNAWKYGDKKRIDLDIRMDKDNEKQLVIAVTSFGGKLFTEEKKAEIFQPKAEEKTSQGYGIGLPSLAKNMRDIGGAYYFENKLVLGEVPPQIKTTFTFVLPVTVSSSPVNTKGAKLFLASERSSYLPDSLRHLTEVGPIDSAKPKKGFSPEDVQKRFWELAGNKFPGFRPFLEVKNNALVKKVKLVLAFYQDTERQDQLRRLLLAITSGRHLIGEDDIFYGANNYSSENANRAVYLTDANPLTILHEFEGKSHPENLQAEKDFINWQKKQKRFIRLSLKEQDFGRGRSAFELYLLIVKHKFEESGRKRIGAAFSIRNRDINAVLSRVDIYFKLERLDRYFDELNEIIMQFIGKHKGREVVGTPDEMECQDKRKEVIDFLESISESVIQEMRQVTGQLIENIESRRAVEIYDLRQKVFLTLGVLTAMAQYPGLGGKNDVDEITVLSKKLFGRKLLRRSSEEFTEFVNDSERRLTEAVRKDKKVVFVIGHLPADMDAILGGSILGAWLNHLIDGDEVAYIPVVQGEELPGEVPIYVKGINQNILLEVNLPRYDKKTEVIYTLPSDARSSKRFLLWNNEDCPDLKNNIFKLKKEKTGIILVDFNDLDDVPSDRIIGIVDHRPRTKETVLREDKISLEIKEIGATALLYYLQLLGYCHEIDMQILLLIQGTALSDTDNRTPKKMTALSILLMNLLQSQTRRTDQEVHRSVKKAQQEFNESDPKRAMRSDRKSKKEWGWGISWANVHVGTIFGDDGSVLEGKQEYLNELMSEARRINQKEHRMLTIVNVVNGKDAPGMPVTVSRVYLVFNKRVLKTLRGKLAYMSAFNVIRERMYFMFKDGLKHMGLEEGSRGAAITYKLSESYIEVTGVNIQLERKVDCDIYLAEALGKGHREQMICNLPETQYVKLNDHSGRPPVGTEFYLPYVQHVHEYLLLTLPFTGKESHRVREVSRRIFRGEVTTTFETISYSGELNYFRLLRKDMDTPGIQFVLIDFKDAGMPDKLTDSVLISDEEIRQLPWKGKGFEVTKKNGEWERALIDKYEVLIAEDITRSQIKSSLHYLLVTNDREKIFAGINSAVRRILQKLINNQTLKLKDWKKISQLLSQYLHDEDDLYTLPCKVDTKDVLDRIRRLLVKIKSLNTKSSLREVAEIYQEFAYLQPFLSTSTRLGRVLRDYSLIKMSMPPIEITRDVLFCSAEEVENNLRMAYKATEEQMGDNKNLS